MSWFQYWWRMQRNAVFIVICKSSWVIKMLNVYYTLGKRPRVGLIECLNTQLIKLFVHCKTRSERFTLQIVLEEHCTLQNTFWKVHLTDSFGGTLYTAKHVLKGSPYR